MSLPWLQDILHGCEANLAARQQEAERTLKQAEEERQAQARSLDEQIAAAVAKRPCRRRRRPVAMGKARTPASSEEHATAHRRAAWEKDPDWCHKHQVTMRWHEGNSRGPGWFSHQLADGSYCKGR